MPGCQPGACICITQRRLATAELNHNCTTHTLGATPPLHSCALWLNTATNGHPVPTCPSEHHQHLSPLTVRVVWCDIASAPGAALQVGRGICSSSSRFSSQPRRSLAAAAWSNRLAGVCLATAMVTSYAPHKHTLCVRESVCVPRPTTTPTWLAWLFGFTHQDLIKATTATPNP